MRYVTEKDKKAVIEDLKPVYKTINEEIGYENLLVFEYDEQVRKTIYTTNPFEGMHRQIRKITKIKGAFSSEQAFMKLMFLIIKDISKKWTMPVHNWGLIVSQLYIKFGDRLKLYRGF